MGTSELYIDRIDTRPRPRDEPPLYCPKCGTPFSIATWVWSSGQRSESLYCVPGEMDLVRALQEIFERRYFQHEPQEPRPAYKEQFHGHLRRWYCPGCGIRLGEYGECPKCHYHLRDVNHPLIERCPHLPVKQET